ncbi:C39 family peptidase [Candidatus Sumerlaeota bacterium]|nr:C39 family peptidase [Candidatus Sumerlaeota bacterium]
MNPTLGKTFRSAILASAILACGACSANRPFDLARIEDPSGLRLVDFRHIRQKERHDCGAGALAIVFAYWGDTTDRDRILREVFSGVPASAGITAADLKTRAEKHGFSAFLLKMSPDEIREQIDLGRPVVVCRKIFGGMNHYEVVVGYDGARRRMIVADPAQTPYSVAYRRFERRSRKTDHFALLVAPRVENTPSNFE